MAANRSSSRGSSSPLLHDVRRWEEASGGLSRPLHAGVAALVAGPLPHTSVRIRHRPTATPLQPCY